MKISAIVGILEPRTYSLKTSLAWAITSSLQGTTDFRLLDPTKRDIGHVTGIVPILQPIQVYVNGQELFLLFMKAQFEVDQFFTSVNANYTIVSQSNNKEIANLFGGKAPRPELTKARAQRMLDNRKAGVITVPTARIAPFLLISPNVAILPQENIEGLQRYVSELTQLLWPSEPIAQTTLMMHLASDGSFLHATDFSSAKLEGGKLVLSQKNVGVVNIAAPVSPRFSRWGAAGKVGVKTAGQGIAAASGSGQCGSTSGSDDPSTTTTDGTDWSSGGSGGGSWGGGGCVEIGMILPGGRQAGDIRVGDTMQLGDESSVGLESEIGTVSFSQRKSALGFRIVTRNGIELVCSESAPIWTDQGYVLAPNLAGKRVATRVDSVSTSTRYEEVELVQEIGVIDVQHITVGNRAFWAGARNGFYLLHHNLKEP